MAWKIKLSDFADKQLKKMDKNIANQILTYMEDEIEKLPDPRLKGKSLNHNHRGLWRYRFRDYRILCQIKDNELIILVISIGHRKDIYN